MQTQRFMRSTECVMCLSLVRFKLGRVFQCIYRILVSFERLIDGSENAIRIRIIRPDLD